MPASLIAVFACFVFASALLRCVERDNCTQKYKLFIIYNVYFRIYSVFFPIFFIFTVNVAHICKKSVILLSLIEYLILIL